MTTQPRCPYCLDDLLPKQERVRCAECRTPHHKQLVPSVVTSCCRLKRVDIGVALIGCDVPRINVNPCERHTGLSRNNSADKRHAVVLARRERESSIQRLL